MDFMQLDVLSARVFTTTDDGTFRSLRGAE